MLVKLPIANVELRAYAGVDIIAYMPSVVALPYNAGEHPFVRLSFGIFVN